MKKTFLIIIFIFIMPMCGCAGMPPIIKNLFGIEKAQVAENMTGVGKVDGKIADSNQMGYNNQANKTDIKQTVGGSINNDAAVINNYIEALKDSQQRLISSQEKADRRFMSLLKLFIGSLFTLIFRYEFQIKKLTSRLLDMISKDKEKDEDRLDKALDKNKKV